MGKKSIVISHDITSKGRFCSRNSTSVKQILNADIFPELEKQLSFFFFCYSFLPPLQELFKYTVSVLPFSLYFSYGWSCEM